MRAILKHQRGEGPSARGEEAMNRARHRWRQSIAAHPAEAITPESVGMGSRGNMGINNGARL